MVAELLRRQNELKALLHKKDMEIQDYRESDAKLSRSMYGQKSSYCSNSFRIKSYLSFVSFAPSVWDNKVRHDCMGGSSGCMQGVRTPSWNHVFFNASLFFWILCNRFCGGAPLLSAVHHSASLKTILDLPLLELSAWESICKWRFNCTLTTRYCHSKPTSTFCLSAWPLTIDLTGSL